METFRYTKTIEEYFEAVKNADTVFGKPSIFNIPLMGGKCIVFGPMQDGDHVYVYKFGENLGVSYAQSLQFFDEPHNKLAKLMEKAEKNSIDGSNTLTRAMYAQTLMDNLYKSLEEYTKSGKMPVFEKVPKDLGKAYGLRRAGDGTDAEFVFEDTKENAVYKISGNMRQENISVFGKNSREPVFYVHFENGMCIINKDGKIYAKYRLGDEQHGLATADGLLTAERIHDIVGESIVVSLGGEIIGTVCMSLNAGFMEIIRHAHTIHVRRAEFTSLMALVTVMITGEISKSE